LADTSWLKKIDADGVAARPREAGDIAKLDRVFVDAEHDWERSAESVSAVGDCLRDLGGISSASTYREAARAFLALLTSPAAREKFKAAGL